jgi:endo-1,4-beta-xylanase
MLHPTRRALLAGATALAAATAAQAQAKAQAQAQVPPAPLEGGLKDIAGRRGIAFGCAVQAGWLAQNPAYAAAVEREAALLVPEGEGKWADLQPREGEFNFRPLETIAAFAQARGQEVRGHTLVWHAAQPGWLAETLANAPANGPPERCRRVLEAHLDNVLARMRGRIRDWDVVNEPIADPARSTEDLRDSPWLRALGPDYIDLTFRWARRADPTLRLVLNDYGLEAADAAAEEKRARMLRLLRGMRERGVPIDAVGLQGHIRLDEPFEPAPLAAFLKELERLQLQVLLTEFDVIEPPHEPLSEDVAARDAAVAQRAHAVVSTAVQGGVRTVLTWGLSDAQSWLNAWPPARRPDGAEVRALPLDSEFHPKPKWHALARSFAGMPLSG